MLKILLIEIIFEWNVIKKKYKKNNKQNNNNNYMNHKVFLLIQKWTYVYHFRAWFGFCNFLASSYFL